MRDITDALLSEVCHGVSVEPCLQPLSGEMMSLYSANTDNNSRRLNIAAYGFWGSHFEKTFLMFGYLTLALDQTGKPDFILLTDAMSKKRKVV